MLTRSLSLSDPTAFLCSQGGNGLAKILVSTGRDSLVSFSLLEATAVLFVSLGWPKQGFLGPVGVPNLGLPGKFLSIPWFAIRARTKTGQLDLSKATPTRIRDAEGSHSVCTIRSDVETTLFVTFSMLDGF